MAKDPKARALSITVFSEKGGPEHWIQGEPADKYHLRLYVAGSNMNSMRAIRAVEEMCRRYLAGRARLEVIDIYQQPKLAKRDGVIAVPCIVKRSPPPRWSFVGNMDDHQRLLSSLGINATKLIREQKNQTGKVQKKGK